MKSDIYTIKIYIYKYIYMASEHCMKKKYNNISGNNKIILLVIKLILK